jgi:hypothetical protein
MQAKYQVYRFDLHKPRDQSKLEKFLNHLEGEIVLFQFHDVDFLLIVEKVCVPSQRIDNVGQVARSHSQRANLEQSL